MATHNTEPLRIARRSVLRTAGHAAWAVPAISVVAAAPAFAVSPGTDDLTDGVIQLTRSEDGSRVSATVVSVTNDGPNVLAPGTIFLTMLISGGASFFTNDTEYEQGDWQAWDADGGVMRYRYMAPVPVGTLSLGGFAAALWGFPPTGTIDAALSYNGTPVASQTLSWPDDI